MVDYVSFYLFCDFKSYFSERNFVVVPTSIYKVQIPTFFRIMEFYTKLTL
ncbi:hypothetical protein LEP1GSC132_3423 [Leptospira kirschneri str. 200803703]|uniref:Uncharacterized protein n=1 Tax=Leptospira kirschneri str. 200802841 TaxID=1193047 RepID=A0A828XYY5_9LEPT|nr:hypothetical protein LEP1GSC044_1629 [Leptospira kirschneri serovar Grippotyphosa str. RM52]EKO50622.1 hypothetical protein LEP1GSC131_0786 [Leptospira kirschneri str. 200802841]EKQ84004.1 hypothetical protein LEP1GSC064_3701 [Leptospira kirschneri serovar Grippotyphosa str. Moskva]EKR10396.1 hypothetical protein LEP1GSC122_3876 [Leptospira kirschneri serovar Valbuzzi str. 200702274]EMK07072.1 hypothetical protein LEP1GSC176_3444 [Leptospira kirschneri str. MMD1493]EMK18821.1 hypothetical p